MVMKKRYSTIEELIKNNLNDDEDVETLKLMKFLKDVKKRGYFTKEEFFAVLHK